MDYSEKMRRTAKLAEDLRAYGVGLPPDPTIEQRLAALERNLESLENEVSTAFMEHDIYISPHFSGHQYPYFC